MVIVIVIVIVISKLLKRYSKAKRTRAPAYSRALRRIKGGFQRGGQEKLRSEFQSTRRGQSSIKRVNVHDNCHQSNFYFENIFINPATTYTVIFYQSRFTYTVIFSSTWPPLRPYTMMKIKSLIGYRC